MRRVALLCICAAALAAVGAVPAGAASGGGCQLDGNAAFSPGLNSSSKAFSYSFSGALTGCKSSVAGSPATGTVDAGKAYNVTYTDPTTGVSHTVTYQLTPTGTGGCSNSTTNGVAVVTWADGTTTVLGYSTTGAAAAVNLSGSVLSSVDVPATSGLQAGDPTSITITTTRYAGYSSQGVVAFQPPDPTACNTAGGVTAAGIHGFVGLGTSS